MDAVSRIALEIVRAMAQSTFEGLSFFALAWIVLRRFRNIGASTRYGIWLCALLALVLVPAVTTTALSLQGKTAASIAASPDSQVLDAPGAEPYVAVPPANMQIADDTSLAPDASWHIAIPQALAFAFSALWALFGIVRATRLVRDYARLTRIRQGAQRWGTRHGYPVLVSGGVEVPLAIGFVRPAILLPKALADDYTSDAVDAILLHEVAHIRRRDVWTNALARILEIVLALNPAAWLITRQLSIERENACDDAVVMQIGSPDAFAKALAKFALSGSRAVPITVPSAGGPPNSIIARIERILEARPRTIRLSASALGGALMFFALVALVTQMISPVLAYAMPAVPAAHTEVAATCGTPNRPLEVKGYVDTSHGRKMFWRPLFPASYGARFRGRGNIAIFDVTVDASGKVANVAVVSTPDRKAAQFAVRRFEEATYRPAIKNCSAVSSTVRTWYPALRTAQQVYSVVAAAYPNGWSNRYPSACKVPNVVHSGVPALASFESGKALTAAVRVTVNGDGAVTSAAIAHASGNAAFDDATLAAARRATYPLNGATGFKPVRPNGADLTWNASHGYSEYSKCRPLPTQYVWTATFKPVGSPIIGH